MFKWNGTKIGAHRGSSRLLVVLAATLGLSAVFAAANAVAGLVVPQSASTQTIAPHAVESPAAPASAPQSGPGPSSYLSSSSAPAGTSLPAERRDTHRLGFQRRHRHGGALHGRVSAGIVASLLFRLTKIASGTCDGPWGMSGCGVNEGGGSGGGLSDADGSFGDGSWGGDGSSGDDPWGGDASWEDGFASSSADDSSDGSGDYTDGGSTDGTTDSTGAGDSSGLGRAPGLDPVAFGDSKQDPEPGGAKSPDPKPGSHLPPLPDAPSDSDVNAEPDVDVTLHPLPPLKPGHLPFPPLYDGQCGISLQVDEHRQPGGTRQIGPGRAELDCDEPRLLDRCFAGPSSSPGQPRLVTPDRIGCGLAFVPPPMRSLDAYIKAQDLCERVEQDHAELEVVKDIADTFFVNRKTIGLDDAEERNVELWRMNYCAAVWPGRNAVPQY